MNADLYMSLLLSVEAVRNPVIKDPYRQCIVRKCTAEKVLSVML